MLCQHRENSPEKSCIVSLERLLFTWKNVRCIVCVPRLLPTEPAKELSQQKQCAFFLSVPLAVLLHLFKSPFNYRSVHLEKVWPFCCFDFKMALAHTVAHMSVCVLTAGDLPGWDPEAAGWSRPSGWPLQPAGELLLRHRMLDPQLVPAVCCLAPPECSCFG